MGEPWRGERRFRFVGDAAGGAEREGLELRVPEVPDPQYGMYAWPCAAVLAQYVWFHRSALPGRRVLELGAGVSLPGIVAAKCGAEVTLSDSEELQQCMDISQQSCIMNQLHHVPVIGITWGRISPQLLTLDPIDIILGSDVFFDPKDFEDILTTVSFLLEKNPHAQFWTTYQVRSADWSIEALLYKWRLKSIHVPLHSFSADKEHLASSSLPSRHTFEMIIISSATSDGT